MSRSTRVPGPARVLLLVVALLAALAAIPPAPVEARVIKVVPLDDTQQQFGAGSRILTAVVQTTLSDTPVTGQITEPRSGASPGAQGGISMAAIRALKWSSDPANELLAGRAEVGAAVIGSNIWIVGGTDGTVSAPYQRTVYRGAVNVNYGQTGAGTITWTTQTAWNLPAVSHYDTAPFNTPIAERTAAATAALQTSGNAGYLYVIGGAVAPGNTFSSNSVLVGDVDANGNLTWRASQPYRLPTSITGLDSASAFVHTTTAGRSFLYVVGGRKTTASISFPVTTFSNQVFYTEIDASGNLALGADNRTWNSMTLPAAQMIQIFNTAATAATYTRFGDGARQDIFFVYGGQTNATTATPTVLKGLIDPNNGAITWQNSSSGGPATIIDALNRHGAVAFDGSIYLVGGAIGANPGARTRNGYATYVDPIDLTLYRDPIANTNFYKDEPPSSSGALPFSAAPGRTNAGVVLVPTTNPAYAFAYLIGGADDTAPRPTVFRATIGPDAQSPVYPARAYYYSKPFSILDLIGEQQATVRKVTWLTNIRPDQGGDIALEYRVYSPSSGNCNDASGTWTALTDPQAGAGRFSKLNDTGRDYAINTQEYTEAQLLPPGNCFQYRATLTRGSSEGISPVLLRLGMEVIVPGNPDLIWPQNAVTTTLNADNTTKGIEVRIRNENTTDGQPTQPADLCHATQPGCDPNGYFFVDVFIFPPGTAPIVPALPLLAPDGNSLSSTNAALAPYHRACLQVPRTEMQKNTTYLINDGTLWSDVKEGGFDNCRSAVANQSISSAKTLFQLLDAGPGAYKVVLVADSGANLKGLVVETDAADGNHPSELNNVSAVFDVTTNTNPQFKVFLPVTQR